MKALLQRVRQAHVEVEGQVMGQIGVGLLVLLCAEAEDTEATGERLLAKILKLRIFSDEAACAGPAQGGCVASSGNGAARGVATGEGNRSGKMNRSVQDVGGALLIVSQFTLAADVRGGNRPSFTAAAPPELGRRLYDAFVAQARGLHPLVQTGVFGADMQVHLVNDGPVTLPIDMR